jgi:succinate dehydrogenase / fumarate reductase iron-sulfur subunit
MDCIFKVYRYDPGKDKAPYFKIYKINCDPNDKILDCLNKIRAEQDGTLSYRMSCAHGICGSDSLRINGEIALACQRLVKNYKTREFTIEPLPLFRIIKDLIVDLDTFFDKYHQLKPFLIDTTETPKKERIQHKEDRKKIEDVIKCILCACCTAACPVNQREEKYIGPAALVRAHRYLFDSRDKAKEERLDLLDKKEGAWGCKTYFKCTEVCPKEIKVTKAITQIKTEIRNQRKKIEL